MNRFSDGFLSTIRDRLPLSEIVGRRVSWDRRKSRPAKGDHWACCPFHGEKTPSFHVDDRKGRYHCFGCSASGDHFRFLMETEGLSFPEAVERLAGEAGVPMPAIDPEAARRQQERLKLVDVLDLAATFFERALQSDAGRHALGYAEQRGLTAPIRETFRIGYAPDQRTALLDHLAARDVPLADMVEAGLVIVPDDGMRKPYDRFRGRLMVAIEDMRGRVVGFGGRILGEGEPKYLNSPETELFRKREMLFNAQRARQAAHHVGRLLVVEGYMDAIALHGAGFQETAASLGTALGEEQVALMWRFADEPIICFDGDKAGEQASHRAMDRALPMLKPGKSLRFLFLPDGSDPDDYVKEHGAEAFKQLLEEARPLIDVLWDRETSEIDLTTPERMAAFQTSLNRLVTSIQDATVRQYYDQALKDRFYALRRALREAANPRSSRPAGSDHVGLKGAKARSAPQLETAEAQLLVLAMHYPDAAQSFADRDVHALCTDANLAKRLEAALTGITDPAPSESLEALPFPVLRQDPSPRFVAMLFSFLFAKLELRAIENEAQATLQADASLLDDIAMTRLVAVQDEARDMKAQINELERQLDEEASVMRAVSGKR